MKQTICQGKLITWKDDRGFGFIKPDDGSQEVFVQISALKGASRRPKVGDRIGYERVTEPNGKVRAAKASIQNRASRYTPTRKHPRQRSLWETVVGVILIAGGGLFLLRSTPSRSPSLVSDSTQPGCTIKGNISIETSNKLYHLPGMEDYESTVIDPARGEKWFCTESEAIANGWRKAPR